MARRKAKTLTELELEIMNGVWNKEEAAVEDVSLAMAEAGKPLALPTIRTMFGILQDKGYLERRPRGRAFVYRAKVSREQARKSIVKVVVERAFEGSALGLVATLFNTRLVSRREVDEVKRLIRNYEGERKS